MRTIISIILLVMLIGCGKSDKKTSEPTAEEQMLVKASGIIIEKFAGDLKKELMSAMTNDGPAEAIKVCQDRAPEISAFYSEKEFVSIKRITDRNRNPSNLADSTQMEILERLQDPNGPKRIWQWAESDQGKVFCYYKPIRVNKFCLKCHGDLESLDPAVSETLASAYPGDRATGYSDGDLRGAFLVEIVWPGGKPIIDEYLDQAEEK